MNNKKITIIDEDKKFLGELEEVLTASGYSSITVNDALSAIDIAIQSKPDVILMELRMPKKNGFELALEMNRLFETQRIPIIAMSTLLNEGPFPFMDLCGINKHIRKPFHPFDVISVIEDAISGNN